MPLLDIIQEGSLGLLEALEVFDWRKGYKFSAYAALWIRYAILRAILNQGRIIRIPVHMAEAINKLISISGQLQQELGREPAPGEIAAKMNMSEEHVRGLLKISREPISLDANILEDDGSYLVDVILYNNIPVSVDPAEYMMMKLQLEEALSILTEREQKVLRLRFGLEDGFPRTLEEIGREYNVPRERIHQIERTAMRKLYHLNTHSRRRRLKAYCD